MSLSGFVLALHERDEEGSQVLAMRVVCALSPDCAQDHGGRCTTRGVDTTGSLLPAP